MSAEYSPTGKDRTQVQPPEYEAEGAAPIIGTKSPGVARIEALSNQITTGSRIAIFIGVFLIAYSYGLVCNVLMFCAADMHTHRILGWYLAIRLSADSDFGFWRPFIARYHQRCQSSRRCCCSGEHHVEPQ